MGSSSESLSSFSGSTPTGSYVVVGCFPAGLVALNVNVSLCRFVTGSSSSGFVQIGAWD